MSNEEQHNLLFLASLLDINPALLFVRNAAGEAIFANKTARAHLGSASLEQGLLALHAGLNKGGLGESTSQTRNNNNNNNNNPATPRQYVTVQKTSALNGQVQDQDQILRLTSIPLHIEDKIEHHTLEIFSDVTELKSASEELERQRQELVEKTCSMTKLNAVTLDMMNGLDVQAILQNVANNTATMTSADYAYIAMVHASGEYLETVAAGNDSNNLKAVKHYPNEGIGGEAWAAAATICVPDYPNYPNRLRDLTSAKQACGVPMLVNGEVIGVIGIMYEHHDIHINTQLDLLENFSKLAAIAIENAKQHELTKRELKRTEAIGELSRAIYGATEFDTLLDRICVTLVSVFDAQKAHIYKLDDSQQLVPLMAWENSRGRVLPSIQVDSQTVNQSLAQWCVKERKTGYTARGVKDERDSPTVHKIRELWQLGSTVCVPLVYEKETWGILFTHRNIDRPDFTDNEISLIEVIGNQTSVAIHRHEMMEQIHRQAFHDELTGLPNRLSFEATLSSSLEVAKTTNSLLALLFIDLDGFKSINDTLGHSLGDKLLKCVAERFNSVLEPEASLARMGGDEFAIVLSEVENQAEVEAVAVQLSSSLEEKFVINELDIMVGASIGISFYPDDALTATELFQHADIAMYNAKKVDRLKISTFNPAHAKRFEERISMERDLKIALKQGQFELHLQPKVTYHNGKVQGVEALARWKHPKQGYISPFTFIPVAEESGLILELGDWVLDEACRLNSELEAQGIILNIAVNISAKQFSQSTFVDLVLSTLQKYRLPANRLELEVTESVVMKDIETVISRLASLRSNGVKIAIDDFGTGYSSLQYLEDLPLDVLKIDKAFVDRLDSLHSDQSLVNIIVLMAKAFNLETVVEGVETPEQLEKVVALGCDHIQGYLYSPPVPAEKLPETIQQIEGQFNSTAEIELEIEMRKAS